MKTTIFLVIFCLSVMFTSCVGIKNIGQLNMVSTRNIETTQKYHLIQKYVTLDKKEMKKTRAESIQEAVDAIVKKVDGGEYLMNVKVYQISHYRYGQGTAYYFSVEGDVWGITPTQK